MEAINNLLTIMRTLRDPENGCPWDRQQGFSDIAPYTLEEAYEVVDAIEREDMKELCAELGDLLFQVVYHSQIAAEKGYFSFSDVVNAINSKLLARHPHVFADEIVENADEQSRRWEELKARERSDADCNSLLDQVCSGLPALTRAQKLQLRAAAAGFDWSDIGDVKAKIEEELKELEAEISGNKDKSGIKDEMGDLLFACVNLARHIGIDAESALRAANNKFESRFRHVENRLKQHNKTPEQATLDEMEYYWQEAKQLHKKA